MADPAANIGGGDGSSGRSKPFKIVQQLGGALDKFIGKKLDVYDKKIDQILRKTGRAAGGGGAGIGGAANGMGNVSSPAGGGGAISLGMGKVTNAFKTWQYNRQFQAVDEGPGPMRIVPRGGGGGGGSNVPWAAVGKVAAGAAAFGYGMLPDVEQAVSQNLVAQSLTSVNGRSVYGNVALSNKLLGGGFSSSTGAQEAAAAVMYSGGYVLGSSASNQIMRQVGGFSIMTGMGNAQVASALSGMNGMNFLRMGVQARDSKGNLNPRQAAAQLYQRMYGGRRITAETASAVWNPGSVAYANTMAAAGGNADLFNILATYQVQMAKNGGKAVSLSDPNKLYDQLGIAEGSPIRKQYDYNKSESGKLAKTGDSLVEGYGAALDAVTAVNNAFNSLTGPLDAVVQGMSKLAGFLDTLPQTGNTGATLFGTGASAFASAGSMATNYLAYKGAMQGINAWRASKGLTPLATGASGGASAAVKAAKWAAGKIPGGAKAASWAAKAAAATPWLSKAAGWAGKAAKFGGAKLIPGVGAVYDLWDTHNVGDADRKTGWDWNHFLLAGASGGVAGAMLGGPWGALAGGLINMANYGISYALGQGGGGDSSGADLANATREGQGGPGGKYRSPAQAAQWALQQVSKGSGGWKGLCERFARTAYNYPAKYKDASAHWYDALKNGRAHRGKNAPTGAFVLWTGGSDGHGHVAISLGGGKVVSTDIKRKGRADVTTIDHINQAWGNLNYQGWADPRHVKLSGNAPAIAATASTVVKSTSSSAVKQGRAVQPSWGYGSKTDSTSSSAVGPSWGMAAAPPVFSGISANSGVSVGDASGFGGGDSATGGRGAGTVGRDIQINMNVKIARSTNEDAVRLARQIKSILESELNMTENGRI